MPRPPRTRILTILEKISFLHRLHVQRLEDAAEQMEISLKQARKLRREHNAFSEDKINDAIRALENRIGFKNSDPDYPYRNYKKQEKCAHPNFKLMFKCTCSKVLSENDIDELIDILERKREKLKVGVRVFDLTGNKVIN